MAAWETQVISVDDPFERRDQRRPKTAMQPNHEGAAVPPARKINVSFASTAGIVFFRACERDRRR
jgi:hypothetical protein